MADEISLAGHELLYNYPEHGMRFRLLFDNAEFTFQRLHNDGEAPFPALAYQVRGLDNGKFIFAFHMPDETYVTLIVDPENGKLYNSMVWGPEQRENYGWTWGIEEAEIERFGPIGS